jgi:AAA family ATPase
MIFKNLSHCGQRRSFSVESVNDNSSGLATFDLNTSSVKIVGREDMALIKMGELSCLELVNIAGIDQALKKLNGFLGNFNRKFRPIYGQRSCGVLLHGGHGTGKTYITEKIVATGWGKAHYIDINAKAATITETFKAAKLSQPSIIVIDELESLVSKDDAISQTNVKVLGQELDSLIVNQPRGVMPQVLVIGTTLNPSDIPISLRKKRRFQTQIALSIPDAGARRSILRSLDPKLHPDNHDEILDKLGERTHAYTAEDLDFLLSTASVKLEERLGFPDSNDSEVYIEQEDIEQALLEVRPTAMHDITLQPPSVRWDDIGGQESVKKALRLAVETPLKVGINPLHAFIIL